MKFQEFDDNKAWHKRKIDECDNLPKNGNIEEHRQIYCKLQQYYNEQEIP
jgi:hypothetical protein